MTLKTLSSRSARSTLSPKEVPGLMAAQTTSKMLPTMTCKDRGQHPGTRPTHSLCMCVTASIVSGTSHIG